MNTIIGREKEIETLLNLYDNGSHAQLVTVYGRRRVGKTFLIDECFKGKITFRHAGLSPVDEGGKSNNLENQLKHFYHSLLLHGMKKSHCPTSWLEAFFMLETWLQKIDNGAKQVVFLDELPWLDTPKSGFVTAFEGFWNTWACHRDNIIVIVCGSATSWILNKLINNHGGLYGRVTCEIPLRPFSLNETEHFINSRGIVMSRYDMVQCDMIFGGIPFYLNYLDRSMSLAQNVDQMFFSEKPILHDEFDRLFASIFTKPEQMKKIVTFLAGRRCGYTREEISKGTGIELGGGLSAMLKALMASDFIVRYVPFGKNARTDYYKLVDPFCIFYLRFVKGHDQMDTDFWTDNQTSQSITTWRGYAFEEVCLRHIRQIKNALGISGVTSRQSSWDVRGDGETQGSQMDLLIERKDNIVSMCEMKFYNEEFTVSKAYHLKINHRVNLLHDVLPKKFAVHPILVTTYGLNRNEYSSTFQRVITIENLFIKA